VYKLEERNKNKLYFDVSMYNLSNKARTIPYNLDKLDLSCGNYTFSEKYPIYFKRKKIPEYSEQNNFVIESEKGDFRNFYNSEALSKISPEDKTSIGEFKNHCQDSIYIHLNPNEVSPIGHLKIDIRALKVKPEDKKVRLWFIYMEGKKIQYIKSNWISLE
jgi:hypothetical protein